MMKATLPLCFALLLASALGAAAQSSPTDNAVDEAVRRQANILVLRQKLVEAQGAWSRQDINAAAKLYEDAYKLVTDIGSGIPAETEQAVSGLTTVRMTLARDARKRGDFQVAGEQVTRVLKVKPNDAAALVFKQENDQALAQQLPQTPHKDVLEQVPGEAADVFDPVEAHL